MGFKEFPRPLYDTYGGTNGDGRLEGAVYGLFAAANIVHPDDKTGIIYEANDLVAVATTDRNGDGSFMVCTEAPGHTYNYTTGTIEATGFTANKNLYGDNSETSWTIYDCHIGDDPKGRIYSNNLDNNGDYWIGRPLLLGQYYIKELSRSEGYELSVSGKNNAITNNGEGLDIAVESNNLDVRIVKKLYYEQQDAKPEELYVEISSKDTSDTGYDIVFENMPEGAKVFRKDIMYTDQDYEVGTGQYVKELLYDEFGQPIWITAENNYQYLKYNEDGTPMTNDIPINATASAFSDAKIQSIDTGKVQEVLKGKLDDATGTYPDETENANKFAIYNDNINTYVKWKVEEILRANGYVTPYALLDTGDRQYSERYFPVYDRGIRKGSIDSFGVSGVEPGQPASKTVYGSAQVTLTFPKSEQLTNGDLILSIINFYVQNIDYLKKP